jgi:hypothetical protein
LAFANSAFFFPFRDLAWHREESVGDRLQALRRLRRALSRQLFDSSTDVGPGTAVAIGMGTQPHRETNNMESTTAFPQLAFNQWLARNLQDVMAALTPNAAPNAQEQQ